MNFRTFFLLFFITSITLCIVTSFFPHIFTNIAQYLNYHKPVNMHFIGIFSLVTAIISYIGLLISYYLYRKNEKIRIAKQTEDRLIMEKIHAELDAMRS